MSSTNHWKPELYDTKLGFVSEFGKGRGCIVLNHRGRFVAEFGGKGNVETIIQGIVDVLSEGYGVDACEKNQWYYPNIPGGFLVCRL